MTNVCIIRVAREQHKVAWGAVTLMSMVDRQRVVPNVVHVSGASLPAPSSRVCAHGELWVQERYDTRSWRLSSTTGKSWRGTGPWLRPRVGSSRIWRRARRRLRRCGTRERAGPSLYTFFVQCTLRTLFASLDGLLLVVVLLVVAAGCGAGGRFGLARSPFDPQAAAVTQRSVPG